MLAGAGDPTNRGHDGPRVDFIAASALAGTIARGVGRNRFALDRSPCSSMPASPSRCIPTTGDHPEELLTAQEMAIPHAKIRQRAGSAVVRTRRLSCIALRPQPNRRTNLPRALSDGDNWKCHYQP